MSTTPAVSGFPAMVTLIALAVAKCRNPEAVWGTTTDCWKLPVVSDASAVAAYSAACELPYPNAIVEDEPTTADDT